MWSSIKGADRFICGDCGQIMSSFSLGVRHLRLLYCNSCEIICQEVSGVNIWDAVDKEKGKVKYIRIQQIISSLNSFEIPIAIWRKK